MKNLKYNLSILLVFFTISSCNVLDEDPFTQPSTENFYQNETDALAALTAAYARLKSGMGYYKQQFMPTLFASSDQGLSTYLYNEFKRGIVTSTNQSLNNLWKEHLIDEMQKTFDHLKTKGETYADPVDRASQEEEFAFELRTRDRERKLISKIAVSLEKIKQDDYGWCDACGDEIGIKRLEARPTATHCIHCKTLDEIKEKQLSG